MSSLSLADEVNEMETILVVQNRKNNKTWQTAPLHEGQFPNYVVFIKDDSKKVKRNDNNK